MSSINFKQVASVGIISWAGAFLEWVDFYTYALLAGIVAKIYFPSEDPIASLLASFAALAIGFLFRPLGAICFGKIGDQFGRKVAFIFAMLLMLIGTLGIGLLPGYKQIGLLASISVFGLRISQGFALGGGYGAAITYLGEFVPEHRRGLFTGFLFTTPAAGMATVGALIWLFSTILGIEFYEWGWRLNFITAGLIVFSIVLLMHFFYKETPIFSMLKSIRRVTSAPIKELFSQKYLPIVLLAWIGVVGAHGSIWYTNQLFNSYYIGPSFRNYVDAATASALLSTATYASLWTYPLFGYISDKIGRKPILLLGIYGNALWFPIAFWLIDQAGIHGNTFSIWFLIWSMTLFNGVGYSGAMSAFLLELFPARIRLSAVGFAYNLGYGITGGLTPFIITWLYSINKDIYISTLIWSSFIPMIMAIWYAKKGPETLGVRIWTEFIAQKFAKKGIILPENTSIKQVINALLNAKHVILIGNGVKIFDKRCLIKAIAKEASLDESADKYAIEIKCVKANSPVTEVFAVLEKFKVGAVPICDENTPIGIVEARELINEAITLKGILKKKIALRYKVYDAITKELISIGPSNSLKEAIIIMANNDIGFLPIIENEKLIGVISETDIVKIIGDNEDLNAQVYKYANKKLIVIHKDKTLKEAVELMINNNIRHLPIIDDNEKVMGVISVKDLIKILA